MTSFRLIDELAISRKRGSLGIKYSSFQLLLLSALLMQFDACAPTLKGGPVPQGEPVSSIAADESGEQRLLILSGSVVDQEGSPLPGVQIVANELESGRTVGTTVTALSGRFRLSLPPGRYKIMASLQGFYTKTYEVTLQLALAADLSIALGDQIPRGEPIMGSPPGEGQSQPCTICVIEKTFTDDTSLHTWLNEQTAQQIIVFAIIPLKDQTSLFCVKPGSEASYSVIAVDGALDRNEIQARVDLNKDMALIGVHRLTGKFLIVFSHGK
jgi:hypothetical protein